MIGGFTRGIPLSHAEHALVNGWLPAVGSFECPVR
jgi:hypothetical protein